MEESVGAAANLARARVSGGAGSAPADFLAAACCAAFRFRRSSLALGTLFRGILRVRGLSWRAGGGSLAACLGCHGGCWMQTSVS